MARATTAEAKRRSLHLAIDAYERGMAIDLNDYYPSSNLPRLYRLRGDADDELRAAETATIAMASCRASLARNVDDPWARLTLLGAASDVGDVAQAREQLDEIRMRGVMRVNLEATIPDLELSQGLHSSPEIRARLEEAL